jgi:hypothetical protein
MGWAEGFAVGLKLREKMDAEEKQRLATEIYNKTYNIQPGETESEAKNKTLVPPAPYPKDYVKGTGFDGQETMMPRGAMSMTDSGVTTNPLKQVENQVDSVFNKADSVMGGNIPVGFATDYTTDVNKTSPFGTYEQTGAQSPADMPFGFNAIPKDYQPMEGSVTTSPAEETPQATITEVPKFSTLPPEVKDKLANARTEDEYNSILTNYQSNSAPKETSLYQKTVEEVSSAQNKLNEHQNNLTKIKSVVGQMRSKGLWKEAADYESKALDAEKAVYESTDAYYKTTSKALDIRAGLANAYLKAVENGANPDWAWNQSILRANQLGIPDMDQYANLQGDKRTQFATMIRDEALSTKDRLKSDLDTMREVGKEERFKRNLTFKQDTNLMKDRWKTVDQNLTARNLDIKEATAEFNMSNKMVGNLQKELKAKQARIDKLRTGDYITDEFGMALQGPERQREAAILNQEIGDIQERLDAALAHTESYKKVLPKDEIKKIENENKIETSYSSLSQQNVDQVTAALNKNPTQVTAITKAFEEQHPGLSITIDKTNNTVKVITKKAK